MPEKKIRIIKKYANRRLYDTEASRYITLSQMLDIVREGGDFKVIDDASGEDITRSVLIQLISEQENSENPLFSTEMLMDFVRYCDEGTRQVFSDFLDKNFQFFDEQHKMFQDQMGKFVGTDAIKTFSDIAQSNLDFWQKMQKNFMDATRSAYGDEDTDSNEG